MKGLGGISTGALLGIMLMTSGGHVWAAPGGIDDAGAQLRIQQEQMEQERIRREMEEAQKEKVGQVTEQAPEAEVQSSEVRFVLQAVKFDESALLSEEELQSLAEPYVGREVSLDAVYDITRKVNKIYSDMGYLTCRAYIGNQTIHGGVVKISLMEGRTGRTEVKGLHHTKEAYVTGRLGLYEGKIQNISTLNRDLYRFNAREDVPLRIMLKPGAETGTTDYVIEAEEPQNSSVQIYMDNAGSLSTGTWREGISYFNRSLSGERDVFSLNYLRAIGMDSGSVFYSRSLGHSGTKVEAAFSRNETRAKTYPSRNYGTRGRSSYLGATFIQPLVTRPTMRSELRFGYGHQNSRTDLEKYDIKWVDNTANNYTLGYQMTTFGKNSAWFQRHGDISCCKTQGGTQNGGEFAISGEDEEPSAGETDCGGICGGDVCLHACTGRIGAEHREGRRDYLQRSGGEYLCRSAY